MTQSVLEDDVVGRPFILQYKFIPNQRENGSLPREGWSLSLLHLLLAMSLARSAATWALVVPPAYGKVLEEKRVEGSSAIPKPRGSSWRFNKDIRNHSQLQCSSRL
jgi:hypothetical protein